MTQEVRKNWLSTPTWPLNGCAWGVGSGWKESSRPFRGARSGAGSEVPSPLQGGLKGLGARGGGDEGLKVEGGFTFGRLQGGFKGASRGLEGGLKGT